LQEIPSAIGISLDARKCQHHTQGSKQQGMSRAVLEKWLDVTVKAWKKLVLLKSNTSGERGKVFTTQADRLSRLRDVRASNRPLRNGYLLWQVERERDSMETETGDFQSRKSGRQRFLGRMIILARLYLPESPSILDASLLHVHIT
jgi:hypothetical protein